MPKPPALTVLYEDNHLLVVDKPAGIATMGAESGQTLHRMAAEYIRQKCNKPGKVFVGIVSRLDSVTTGVIVMARTSKGASRLAPQFAGKANADAAKKTYLAAIPGHLDSGSATLFDHVYKDDSARRMRLCPSSRDGAVEAKLQYITLGENEDVSLLAIQLLTGRKHQIRVQLADRGFPILGDRKYGSKHSAQGQSFSPGIALHSWKLEITHPTQKKRMSFSAHVPSAWRCLRLPESCFGKKETQQ